MHTATYLLDIAALGCLMGMLHSDTALNAAQKTVLAAAILSVVAILSEAGQSSLALSIWICDLHIFFNTLGLP